MTTLPNDVAVAFVKRLGFGELPPEKARAVIAEIAPVLLGRLFAEVDLALSDEDRKIAADLVQREDIDALFAHLKARIPDLEERVRKMLPKAV